MGNVKRGLSTVRTHGNGHVELDKEGDGRVLLSGFDGRSCAGGESLVSGD